MKQKPLKSKIKSTDYFWIYIFLVPMILLYLIYIVWPIFASIYYSFFQWNGFGAWPDYFIGFRNYIELLNDREFWNALKNTFIFVFLNNIIKLPLTLVLAYLLNNILLKGSKIYRAILFLPVVTSTAVIGIIMTVILNPWNGPLNQILNSLHLIKQPLDLLGNTKTALITIILIGIWQFIGQYIVYWMAGLQSIPSSLYEAAKIDGANNTQIFFKITLPALKPVIIIVAFLGIAASLRAFDVVWTTTQGGPIGSTEILSTMIYRTAFATADTKIGYASAIAIFFGVIMVVIGVIQNSFNKKND